METSRGEERRKMKKRRRKKKKRKQDPQKIGADQVSVIPMRRSGEPEG